MTCQLAEILLVIVADEKFDALKLYGSQSYELIAIK